MALMKHNAPMSGCEARSAEQSAPLMKWTPPALFVPASMCQSRIAKYLLPKQQKESTHEV
jgi:hypothetical protein